MVAAIERRAACLVLCISGDLRVWNRGDVERSLSKELRLDSGVPGGHVLLSLGGVTHIDTKGITLLVQIAADCSTRGLKVSVVMPAGLPGDAIKWTRILASWPQFADEQAALTAIEQASSASTG